MSQGSTLEPKWRWTVAEARRAPLEPGRASPSLFRRGTMNLRWYAPRGRDDQTPHEQDEVYAVASGRGSFSVDRVRLPFGPGDLLFVPAGVEHRFEDFSADFGAWVLFWGPTGGETARTAAGADRAEGWRWTVADAEAAPRERDDPFAARLFRHASMNLWWYAPRGRDPQDPHEQDEIYFVESGSGRFLADGQGTAFGPGDVLFVPAGAAHRFEDFSDDLAAWAVFWGPAGGEES
jgi:mannose-6-phosphate isomerase-like protein (cupin superfamily)